MPHHNADYFDVVYSR